LSFIGIFRFIRFPKKRHALGAKAHHTFAKGTKVSGGAREFFFFAASNIPFGYVKIAMEHGPNFVDLPSNVTSTIVKGRPPYIFFLGGSLLCSSKSKIPTLPQGFCKVLTNPMQS